MRLLYSALVVAAFATGNGAVSAQDTSGDRSTDPRVSGIVTAVTASNVTLAVGAEKIIFGVDSLTRVVGKQATLKNDLVYRGPTTIVNFVKAGDHVTVTFRQSGGNLLIKVLRFDQK
jgi:hypothetical protein